MLTYPRSTSGVLRMLMHLSLGHVTLPPGEFHPWISPHEFSPNRTYGAGWTHVGLCAKFLVLTASIQSACLAKKRVCKNLENGDPSETNVIERYRSMERITVTGSTVRVIEVPVDTGGVGGWVICIERSAAVAFESSALNIRKQVGTLGHALRLRGTAYEVVPVVAVIVLRQFSATHKIIIIMYAVLEHMLVNTYIMREHTIIHISIVQMF